MADEKRSGLVPFDLHIYDLDFMVYTLDAHKNADCVKRGVPADKVRACELETVLELLNAF